MRLKSRRSNHLKRPKIIKHSKIDVSASKEVKDLEVKGLQGGQENNEIIKTGMNVFTFKADN